MSTVFPPTSRWRRPHGPAVLALTVTALLGCSDPAGPDPGGSVPDPISELPRALTATEVAVIESSNAFGFRLASQVARRDARPNLVLSPLSASMALGMTLNGARGATFEAMRTTLEQGGLSVEEINDSYRGLLDLLLPLDPSVEVSIANAIWANEDVPFHEAFFEAVRIAFDAAAQATDFDDPATLDEINRWAAEQTHGRIEKILDTLDPDLVMLLLNAIWFDGKWTTEFDPEKTGRAPFHRPDGSTVQVDLMRLDGVELPLGSGADWVAAELPYGGGAWSMVLLVPQGSRSARELLIDLDAAAWDQVLESLHPIEVDEVALPKFDVGYDAFLNDALSAMGMEVAFGPGADFTGLSPVGDHLCIDFVRQKTFLEVDEAGTRAAAVTAVGIGPTSFIGLRADRPFVFALRERLSGTILFMGLIEDPTEAGQPPEPFEGQCH